MYPFMLSFQYTLNRLNCISREKIMTKILTVVQRHSHTQRKCYFHYLIGTLLEANLNMFLDLISPYIIQDMGIH